jgi:hypothetical protein
MRTRKVCWRVGAASAAVCDGEAAVEASVGAVDAEAAEPLP